MHEKADRSSQWWIQSGNYSPYMDPFASFEKSSEKQLGKKEDFLCERNHLWAQNSPISTRFEAMSVARSIHDGDGSGWSGYLDWNDFEDF